MTFTAAVDVASRLRLLWALAGLLLVARPAAAYVPGNPWTMTASGPTAGAGRAITLTWSIAPDGTPIPGQEPSNLIARLDDDFGVTLPEADLTTRPWFAPIQQAFDRWSQLGGITFVYQPNDDGSQLQTSPGRLSTLPNPRGDVRLGGEPIDGAAGTVAYAWFPNQGDIIFDTSQEEYWFAKINNNYRRLRNVLMHELGHTFGLQHVVSTTDKFLLEPQLDTTFDGPQLDDIRGIQGLYGDVYEKSFSGQGNNVFSRATSLGSLAPGGSLSLGGHAATGQSVAATETDFVSIANQSDHDYFSFSLTTPSFLDVTLTPLGGISTQAAEGETPVPFDASSVSNLALALFGTNGTTLLDSANLTPAGGVESLAGLSITEPGQYYVRVTGSTSSVQLYQLDLSATSMSIFTAGDYNQDGTVDAADYTVWRDSLGQLGTGLLADGDNDGAVDYDDYLIWKGNFGISNGSGSVVGGAAATTRTAAVPEPASVLLCILPLVAAGRLRRRPSAP